jgi:hypothetical protein
MLRFVEGFVFRGKAPGAKGKHTRRGATVPSRHRRSLLSGDTGSGATGAACDLIAVATFIFGAFRFFFFPSICSLGSLRGTCVGVGLSWVFFDAARQCGAPQTPENLWTVGPPLCLYRRARVGVLHGLHSRSCQPLNILVLAVTRLSGFSSLKKVPNVTCCRRKTR